MDELKLSRLDLLLRWAIALCALVLCAVSVWCGLYLIGAGVAL